MKVQLEPRYMLQKL